MQARDYQYFEASLSANPKDSHLAWFLLQQFEVLSSLIVGILERSKAISQWHTVITTVNDCSSNHRNSGKFGTVLLQSFSSTSMGQVSYQTSRGLLESLDGDRHWSVACPLIRSIEGSKHRDGSMAYKKICFFRTVGSSSWTSTGIRSESF